MSWTEQGSGGSPNGHAGNGLGPGPDLNANLQGGERIETVVQHLLPYLSRQMRPEELSKKPRRELAEAIDGMLQFWSENHDLNLSVEEQRDVASRLVAELLMRAPPPSAEPEEKPAAPQPAPEPQPAAADAAAPQPAPEQKLAPMVQAEDAAEHARRTGRKGPVEIAKDRIQGQLLERIDTTVASAMQREELTQELTPIIAELMSEHQIALNSQERKRLIELLLDDMLGLGPLEDLLKDESVTDIMVNGAKQVYVERGGKLTLTDTTFRDDAHVMQVATRIVTTVGRRVDETTPLVDARLKDGSRVNIIIPPLAIDGPSISIRKFAKQKITLDVMERQNNLSSAMATVLRIAGRCRLNLLVSGGTGSGKTTLLNAISQMIDHGERIVTIEDAAELQLQQPHVVRLETRPANLEGKNEIAIRDLVKNALRMRPDRIIVGEIRGGEAIDMLQAMNTGHDGSLSTVHANRPREALMRLENMVGMSDVKLPAHAVRMQIASAVDMIVQVSRMRDGVRRITKISEVVGMEGDIITMQDLFSYEYESEDEDGKLIGTFKSHGIRPHFAPRAAYFGLDRALLEAI